jgi:hypothetical protein
VNNYALPVEYTRVPVLQHAVLLTVTRQPILSFLVALQLQNRAIYVIKRMILQVPLNGSQGDMLWV